jgi:hypothetical protein
VRLGHAGYLVDVAISGFRADERLSAVPAECMLLDGSGAAHELVGGKAATLDRLLALEVDVPPTAVVTTRCA